MKHSVIASLELTTPAQQDNLHNTVLTRIAGKPTWGEKIIAKGLTMNGKPAHTLSIRFEQPADMDDLFSFIKNQMTLIPVLKGSVSKHNCPHDEGNLRSCVISEEFIK